MGPQTNDAVSELEHDVDRWCRLAPENRRTTNLLSVLRNAIETAERRGYQTGYLAGRADASWGGQRDKERHLDGWAEGPG